jgi:hypothetical protein
MLRIKHFLFLHYRPSYFQHFRGQFHAHFGLDAAFPLPAAQQSGKVADKVRIANRSNVSRLV